MSEGNGKHLANGWAHARIGELVYLINGRAFKPAEWVSSGTPIIRIQNLNDESASFNYFAGGLPAKFRVESGDLLFAWSGTPGTSFGAHIWRRGEAWLNQHIFKVEFEKSAIDPRFLMHAINQNLAEYIRQAHGGAGLAHITKGRFEETDLRIAPLGEQVRIADALDELLSDLDAAVAALDRLRRKARQYRAAMLKAAVEGTLTAEWRKAHPDVEPASELLKRILVERRRRWEESQLKKYGDGAKESPKNWTNTYPQPAAPDLSELPKLPDQWVWVSLDQVASLTGGVTKGQKVRANEVMRDVPYLRVANVQRGYLDLAEVKTIRASEDDIRELALLPGDVLFNEGGDRDKLGRGWIWEGQIKECIHQNHVFRARLLLDALSPKLVSWCGNSYGQGWFSRTGKQSVNLASINLNVLRSFPVPVVARDEQERIIEIVEAQLSVIDHLESDLEAKLESAQALRQSILKAAFEGKLVPQDPNDEPASELLKRIAAERAERERLAKEAKKPAKPAEGRGPKRGQDTNAASTA